jgi:hypothetical protein
MTINSAEMSYPIGAFGKRKCEEIAAKTGVIFDKFNPANRRNGFQNIRFTGPSTEAITEALDLLDAAVTKFNRHKEWERKMRISNGLHATQKRDAPVKTAPRKSRFEGLTVDVCDTTGAKADTTGAGKPQWTTLDVSGAIPSMISTRKQSIWEEKTEQRRKKYDAPSREEPKINPAEKTQHEVAQRIVSIDEVPEPPLWAQKAWHEADMGRPMLEPSTGPIQVDEEYQTAYKAWQEAFLVKNSAPTEDELLDEASEMFEECRHELPQPPVTEQEIIDEWDEWELEHDVALNVIDEAIANREFQTLNFVTLPPDHILGPNGELCILERAVTDPAYLTACPC